MKHRRIDFRGDLSAWPDIKIFLCRIEKGLCLPGGQQEGVPPPKYKLSKEGKISFVKSHFPHNRFDKLIHQLNGCDGVEAAIPAFAQTKWNMYIKPGRFRMHRLS